MTQLGLTEAEQKLAMIDPGFTGAGITTRLDGFIHGREIKFVEYNAENPSSLSDQEGLNRLLRELRSMSMLARCHLLQLFSAVENDSVVVRYGTKEAQ
jgi:glutathionylspermidine synthase